MTGKSVHAQLVKYCADQFHPSYWLGLCMYTLELAPTIPLLLHKAFCWSTSITIHDIALSISASQPKYEASGRIALFNAQE